MEQKYLLSAYFDDVALVLNGWATREQLAEAIQLSNEEIVDKYGSETTRLNYESIVAQGLKEEISLCIDVGDL